MKIILILFLTISLSGCTLIHYTGVLLHKQDTENRTEYNKFLSRRGFDTTFSYQIQNHENIDSLSSKQYAINVWKIEHNGRAGLVQLRMYDNSGKFISGWENCYGELKYFNLFDSIPFRRFSSIEINPLINLHTDLSLVEINNKEALLNQINLSEYVITIYYAKWGGYYTRNALKNILSYYNRYKDDNKILLIFINVSP